MSPTCLCRPYYGLGDEFPRSQLLTRSVAGKKRNIYLTSSLVKELLQRNELHVKVCCTCRVYTLLGNVWIVKKQRSWIFSTFWPCSWRVKKYFCKALGCACIIAVSVFTAQFINVGVKVLARCDNHTASCPFRICQEVSHSCAALSPTFSVLLCLREKMFVTFKNRRAIHRSILSQVLNNPQFFPHNAKVFSRLASIYIMY